MIPFYEATVHLKVGELVTITAKVPAEMIDIEALEKNTELVIKKPKSPRGGSKK